MGSDPDGCDLPSIHHLSIPEEADRPHFPSDTDFMKRVGGKGGVMIVKNNKAGKNGGGGADWKVDARRISIGARD